MLSILLEMLFISQDTSLFLISFFNPQFCKNNTINIANKTQIILLFLIYSFISIKIFFIFFSSFFSTVIGHAVPVFY